MLRLETAKEETLMIVRMSGTVTVVEEFTKDESIRATKQFQDANELGENERRAS